RSVRPSDHRCGENELSQTLSEIDTWNEKSALDPPPLTTGGLPIRFAKSGPAPRFRQTVWLLREVQSRPRLGLKVSRFGCCDEPGSRDTARRKQPRSTRSLVK